jgi:hypothetical protein
MSSDTEYLLRRLQNERRAARLATDLRVRERHLEFAAAYELRLRELGWTERRQSSNLVDAA